MQTTSDLPFRPDTAMYPFRSRFIRLKSGTMHYIDEGKGEPLLFVHGTPAWSFLYRHLVKAFSGHYRCVAIDHIGFGLSEKPLTFPGRPQDHAENLSEFLQTMDLQEVTLVVHDFGGPIGLAAAIRHPGRIKRIVLFNTWLWETASSPEVKKIDKMINSRLGKWLYLRYNISPRLLLKKGFSDQRNLSKAVHRQYLLPFPDKNSRMALYHIARGLRGASQWYQQQWEQLSVLTEKDWLIIWGVKDQFINTGYLHKWKERLPAAKVTEIEAGHFLQEEQPDKCIQAIREVL